MAARGKSTHDLQLKLALTHSGDDIGLTEAKSRSERISVVRTLEDFVRVVAVRSIVYVDGQSCLSKKSSTETTSAASICLDGSTTSPPPACGCAFFANFAKVERLAVRKEFRTSSIAARIVRTGLAIVSRKGYRTAYGHARLELESFWSRFGARRRPTSQVFSFSGQQYVEMVLDLPPINDVIDIEKDPRIINRPEGDWDRPGVLEAGRPADPERGIAARSRRAA